MTPILTKINKIKKSIENMLNLVGSIKTNMICIANWIIVNLAISFNISTYSGFLLTRNV